MSYDLPTLAKAKGKARELRAQLHDEGHEIGHSQSLELIAIHYGYRDWNTLYAAIKIDAPNAWVLGQRVRGHYLSQPFTAKIIAVTSLQPGWYRLTLDLDEAVDVVTFDSFSNFRQRITKTVGPAGTTREKTSNGRPHLELEL